MDLPVNLPSAIAQAFNFIALFAIIGVAVFVFRDATKRKISTKVAVLWALLSGFTFPIGLLLYIFLGRKISKHEHALSP
jgi:formate/nitrite transporter FocA (FNT family)